MTSGGELFIVDNSESEWKGLTGDSIAKSLHSCFKVSPKIQSFKRLATL